MQTVVQKWGNSLGIRIPKAFVQELELKNGSSVDIAEEEGKIIIQRKKITLNMLLEEIDENNLPEKIETGDSVGKEEW
jgi:antitoxin MazE